MCIRKSRKTHYTATKTSDSSVYVSDFINPLQRSNVLLTVCHELPSLYREHKIMNVLSEVSVFVWANCVCMCVFARTRWHLCAHVWTCAHSRAHLSTCVVFASAWRMTNTFWHSGTALYHFKMKCNQRPVQNIQVHCNFVCFKTSVFVHSL